MLSALKPANSENINAEKELIVTDELYKKEIQEIRERHSEILASYERQLNELKTTNLGCENKIKQLIKMQSEYQENAALQEKEYVESKKNLEDKIERLEEEKRKMKTTIEIEIQARLVNQGQYLENIKADYNKEKDKLKEQYEKSLSEIKNLHEMEKKGFDERYSKICHELNMAHSQKEESVAKSVNEIQSNYIEEIQELNAHLDAFKKQSYEELAGLKKERDEALKKIEALEKALAKKVPEIKVKKMQSKQINEQKEIDKFKKQNADLKSYIAKLEAKEKVLMEDLSKKTIELEVEKENFKQELSAERKNASDSYVVLNKVKEEYTKARKKILDEKAKNRYSEPNTCGNKDEDTLFLKGLLRDECKKCRNIINSNTFSDNLHKNCLSLSEEQDEDLLESPYEKPNSDNELTVHLKI